MMLTMLYRNAADSSLPTVDQLSFLSAGTDGEDGNVAVAGAQFDLALLKEIRRSGLLEKPQTACDLLTAIRFSTG